MSENVVKYGSTVYVTEESLRPSPPITREDRERIDYGLRELENSRSQFTQFLAQGLETITDLVLRAVIDHHADHDGYCYGCDGEDAEYPCSTLEVIGRATLNMHPYEPPAFPQL
jgi:hypothetical protein